MMIAWRGILGLAVVLSCALTAPARGQATAAAMGWQVLGNDPYGAATASATLGRDGNIYILMGDNDHYPTLRPGFAFMQAYNVRRHTWAKLPAPQLLHDAVLAVGNTLYAVGGDQQQAGSDTEYLLPGAHRWLGGFSTKSPFGGAGAALGHDGRIYLVGGGPFLESTSDFEVLAPATRRWTVGRQPSIPISLAGVTSGPNGQIYVLGGTTYTPRVRASSHVTNAMQVYDPKLDRWSLAAPMPTARAALAAVTARDGKIYAIGGTSYPIGVNSPSAGKNGPPVPRKDDLAIVEVYDPKTNRWSTGPSLHVARSQLAAVMAPDGKIYAIGGSNLDVIETLAVPAAGT